MLRMFSFPRKPGRTAGALILLSLTATACVSPDDPGVKINPLSAELVFGAKQEETQVAGLQQSAPLPEEVIFEDIFEEDEIIEEEAAAPPPRQAPTRERAVVEDFVPEPEEPFVCYPYLTQPAPRGEPFALISGKPPLGVLRWNNYQRIGGTQVGNAVEGGEIVATAPTSRLITNYREFAPGELDAASDTLHESPAGGLEVPEFGSPRFAFDTVSPFGEYFLVSTYTVGRPFITPNTLQQVYRVSQEVNRPRPPDAGVVLTRTEVVDEKGAPVPGFEPFEPANGLMVLPLPATATDKFVSVAVDTNTGKVVQYDGTVIRVTGSDDRINACGEPVDGWMVHINVTVLTPGPAPTYDDVIGNVCSSDQVGSAGAAAPRCFVHDLIVAPQHGGIVIAEGIAKSPYQAQGAGGQGFDPRTDIPAESIKAGEETVVEGCPKNTTTTSTTTTTLAVNPPPNPPTTAPTPPSVPTTAPNPSECRHPKLETPFVQTVPASIGVRYEDFRTLGTLDPEPFSGELKSLRTHG